MTQQERAIWEENLKLHKSEAYYYEVQHPEIYNFVEQRRIRSLIKALRQTVKLRNPLCLDLGSGTGNLLSHIEVAGFDPVACDLSPDMLRYNKAANRILCEVAHLPFRDGVFTLITAYSLFHHLPCLSTALQEMCRVSACCSRFYIDHEPFCSIHKCETRIRSPLQRNPFQLLNFMLWIMSKPAIVIKFLRYVFYGRTKHLHYIKGVNFQLTDRSYVDLAIITKMIEEHGYIVKAQTYKTGKLLVAYKLALFRKNRG
jgi:ubiquinone/menaquinone biosynthesis C-methylase UbiE